MVDIGSVDQQSQPIKISTMNEYSLQGLNCSSVTLGEALNQTKILKESLIQDHLKAAIDKQNNEGFDNLLTDTQSTHQVSQWPIVFFLTTSALCLAFSTIFHLFYPMSPWTYKLVSRFDFAGIALLSAGTVFPPIYYGMYCQFTLVSLYLTTSCTFSTIGLFCLLSEWFHLPEYRNVKAIVLGGLGLTAFVPVIHMGINEAVFNNHGDPFTIVTSLPHYILMSGCYFLGLYVYTVRCPERHYPGKFNICGASHQIWHGLVVLAMALNYLGAIENFEMRVRSVCPV